jgi:UDP-glucuronate decarboxylase
MNSPENITGPINIGNPGEFTMLELAKEVIRITGSKSEIKFMPLPSDDPKQRQPDISKATDLLDWSPKISLSQGLEASVPYFRNVIAH